MEQAPDTLVLGGGGILGEAWMLGVLAGIDQAGGFDARESRGFVGTSAGSIVAATLAAGIAPASRLGTPLEQRSPAARDATARPGERGLLAAALAGIPGAFAGLTGAVTGPLASVALAGSSGGGAFLRRGLLRGVGPGRRSLSGLVAMVDRGHVRWDGRLLIVAVDEASGRRVVFGAPGAPEVTVGVAVAASCAIPGFFRPVQAGDRSYVDGGVWSPTNIDLARAGSGRRVLCLNPTGSMRPSTGALAGALGPVSRTIAATEAHALRSRGAAVTIVNPDRDAAALMGVNLMNPAPRSDVIAAALQQGHELVSAAHRPSRQRPRRASASAA